LKPIKKTVYTVNINDYEPAITALTYPFIQHWCDKIGAEFHVIKERKSPHLPIVMEKLQVRDLARERGDDWAICVDSDALINPEMFDPTNYMKKDTVAHNGRDMNGVRYTLDHYFLRDGRNIGSCNWFTIASDWCLDLWAPLDIPFEAALRRVHPTVGEHNSGLFTDHHLLDDYTLSRNIARFGLKFTTITEMSGELGWRDQNGKAVSPFLFHLYAIPAAEKLEKLLAVLSNQPSAGGWGLMTGDQVMEFKKAWNVK
jgi:hypothetical protein